MKHLKKGRTLGRKPDHKKLLIKNMLTSLFRHGRIETTSGKAKELRPIAEKMITKARKGTLANRRLIAKSINDKKVLKKLFEEIAPKYLERPGGYVRIIKKGYRQGDNAQVSIIELV